MTDIIIRRAVREDVPFLLDIYNYEVVNSAATLDLNPRTLDEWYAWYEAHQTDLHPLFVAECAKAGTVLGYSSFSPFRSKEGYRSTVELSIYVSKDARGRGVATMLLEALVDHAWASDEIHLVISIITSENVPSMHLHRKFGFTYRGTLHEVGHKMGRYVGISIYELMV